MAYQENFYKDEDLEAIFEATDEKIRYKDVASW